MRRSAIARLDAGALRHNLERARTCAPCSSVFAVIKAEGYGHGLEWCAGVLGEHCGGFAVASVGEGIALREAGFADHRICVLNGPVAAEDLAACADHALEPLIHQDWQQQALAAGGLSRPVSVWLKVETGMGRLGVAAAEAAERHRRLAACADVTRVGLMTHFACADDRADDYTRRQITAFAEAVDGCKGERSLANSAAVLAWPDAHDEWVRPGIMLYGCSPFIEGAEAALDLLPVMTLESRLIAVNHLPAGSHVGYGRTWTCPEDMPVGVAGIGYGDGYPRHARNGTPVLVGGQRAPLVGRVSMDKITVDLRSAPQARPGDLVVLWGRGLPVEEIAAASDTIGYELLCGVHGRVPISVDDPR